MSPSTFAALCLTVLLMLVPPSASALGLQDCEDWLEQIEGEVGDIDVSGADGAQEQEALLKDLQSASSQWEGAKGDASLKNVEKFRKRAARLASEGKIGRIEGTRLNNLADTVRHCIDQVEDTDE